jgi:hypothetical protein
MWASRPIVGAASTVASSVAPDRPQLLDEHAGEVELTGRAGAAPALPRGLGVDAHVAQEALEEVGSDRLGERRGEGRLGLHHPAG